MRTLVSFLVLFCFVVVKPASLTGFIYDSSDNMPLSGVIIRIQGLSQAFVSSESGSFSIKNLKEGTYTLQISSIGYKSTSHTIRLTSSNDTTVSVGLSPVIEDLETVVITGTRSEKRLKDVPVLTQVIHPNYLKEIGINTVSAALEHEVPGFDLAQFNYRSKVTFQGMNAKYLLFLVDGERIAGEMDGDIDYTRLNIDNVDRIEVVRGASSVLYGSNAIGGVINIITKKQVAKFNCSAHARYSANNEIFSGASVGFRNGRLVTQSNFNYNQSNGYSIPGDTTRFRTQDKFKNISLNQKFTYEINTQFNITASGNVFYNRVYDGYIIPADHAYFGSGGYLKAVYEFKKGSSIELSHAIDDYVSYNVFLKDDDKHHKYSSDFQQSTKIIGNVTTKIGQLVAGLEYLPDKIYSIRVTDSVQQNSERIAFFQDDYKLNDHFSFVGGFRVTHHSKYGLNTVPKISAMANFQPLVLRASYGLGFRSPSLKEMYFDFDHLGMFKLIGNPNLRPEKSEYLGFSTELNQSKSNFSVNFYRNYVKDMIVNLWVEPKVGQYFNIATATILGIDIMEKAMLSKNLIVSAGISLVDAKNNETNKQVYGISPISVNGSIRYSFLIYKELASIELYSKYVGARNYEPVGETYYNDKAFQNWRISYAQQFQNMISFCIGVDNLLNRVDPNSLGNTSPGRRYFVSLSFNLVKY